MKNLTPVFILFLAGIMACTPSAENAGSEDTTDAEETTPSPEEAAINQAVLDAYAVISYEEGETPDYDKMAEIFTPNAVLQNFRYDTLQSYPISTFIKNFKASVESGQRKSFQEAELGGETEYFGKIGHRISAYASYVDGEAEPRERGVNSFQLMKMDGKWRVSSIIWDVEKESQPIPDRYLDK